MARGPAMKPEYDVYRAVGYGTCGLYLVEAGPIVKIGQAISMASRLMTLHREFARQGYALSRFHVFRGPYLGTRFSVEWGCVKALRKVAQSLPGRRGYFTGITYDDALALVRPIVEAS